jgi:hypothetical protein
MYYFTKYTYQILDRYRSHLEIVDSFAIGFTGTASERLAPVYTDVVDADVLWFAAHTNFSNANALVRIVSISPQYQWMANQQATPQDTPITAIAGVTTQALPVLPLIQPFFLKAQGRLQHIFTNSATSATTGGIWTWRGLKLTEPIDGGWDYNIGFKA